MKSSAFYAVLGIGVLIMAVIVWLGMWLHAASHSQTPANKITASQPPATTTPLTGYAIYTNGSYGFSIFYPQRLPMKDSFATTSSSAFKPIVQIGITNDEVSVLARASAGSCAKISTATMFQEPHDGTCFEILTTSSSTPPDPELKTITESFSFARP